MLVIMTTILLFACIAVSFLYRYFVMRYLVVVLLSVFVFARRKSILEALYKVGVGGKLR